MLQLFASVIGFLVGILWERFSTSPIGKRQTLLPSLKIKYSQIIFHLHHWTAYAICLIIIITISWNTKNITNPLFIFLNSILLGALGYNFWKFPDWYKFFK